MKNKKAIVLLFTANTISGISQGISLIAIPWYIANQLERPGLYGLLYLLATVLAVFWGPYAGTLIDKYDRKKLMLGIQFTGFLLLTGLTFYAWHLNYTPLWVAGSVMILTKLIYNIHYPNLYAFAQEITEKNKYGTISAALEVQGQTTFILAGAVAAFLMEGKFFSFTFNALAIHEIFMIDAATYVIGLFVLSLIKYDSLVERIKTPNEHFVKRMKDGFQYLKSRPLILIFGTFSGFLFASILVCSFFTMPIFIDKFLGGTESTYGIVEASFAFGSMLSGAFILLLFPKHRLTIGIIFLSVISSLAFFFVGLNTAIPWFFAAYALIGFCNAGIRVLRTTYLFNVIDNNVIGRTNSVFMVINSCFRILFIGLFSIPFFATAEHINKTMLILATFVLLGAIVLLKNRKSLIALNQ